METKTIAVVVAVFIIVMVIVAVAVGSKLRQGRIDEVRKFAQQQRWDYVEQDSTYSKKWPGPPFDYGGKAEDLISGEHRGRRFLVFTHTHTTSRYDGTMATTQSHVHAIYTITLPDQVPSISVGAEGMFGGKVAEAFGYTRIDTGDQQFDDAFKVKSDDAEFARGLLQPAVVDYLKSTGPWEWRFAGDTMINTEQGKVELESITARLDRMCDVLDRMPEGIWPSGRGHLR